MQEAALQSPQSARSRYIHPDVHTRRVRKVGHSRNAYVNLRTASRS
jgi:hypothetical protein